MGNATDSFFSVSHVAPPSPFITQPPSPPPSPRATTAMSTKLGPGMWPSDENQLAQWDPHMKSATAQISVSIIMSPIYSENELIVEWCLVIHTMPQLDGLLPRGPAIE